jgi:hypothetical protein
MAVLALLFAQLGALSHAYTHDAYAGGAPWTDAHGQGAFVHDGLNRAFAHDGLNEAFAPAALAGAASVRSSGAASHSCGTCLAFAPLLSAAGSTSALPFTLTQGRNSAGRSAAGSLVDLSPLLAFRSRAPPYAS